MVKESYFNPFGVTVDNLKDLAGIQYNTVIVSDALGKDAEQSGRVVYIDEKVKARVGNSYDCRLLCAATGHCEKRKPGSSKAFYERMLKKKLPQALVVIPKECITDKNFQNDIYPVGDNYIGVSRFYGTHVFIVDCGTKKRCILLDIAAMLGNADIVNHWNLGKSYAEEVLRLAKDDPSHELVMNAVTQEIRTNFSIPFALVNAFPLNKTNFLKEVYPPEFNEKLKHDIRSVEVINSVKYDGYVGKYDTYVSFSDTATNARFIAALGSMCEDAVREKPQILEKAGFGLRVEGERFAGIGSSNARQAMGQIKMEGEGVEFGTRLRSLGGRVKVSS